MSTEFFRLSRRFVKRGIGPFLGYFLCRVDTREYSIPGEWDPEKVTAAQIGSWIESTNPHLRIVAFACDLSKYITREDSSPYAKYRFPVEMYANVVWWSLYRSRRWWRFRIWYPVKNWIKKKWSSRPNGLVAI